MRSRARRPRAVAIRALYLPTIIYGIGQGAVVPIIAFTARDLHASISSAGVVVAMLGVGQLAGDLPAGLLVHRFGERRAMLMASAVAIVALLGCALTRGVLELGLCVLVLGAAGSVWGLARQAYIADHVPQQLRARTFSALGGSQRMGIFVGPFVGAAFTSWLGLSAGYYVHAVAALAAGLLVHRLPELAVAREAAGSQPAPSMLHVVSSNRRTLSTVGFATMILGALRGARPVVLPLWAAQIGLDVTQVSLVFGLSGLLEMLTFYPGGLAMDRFGRRWIALPSMCIMSSSLVWLVFTHTYVELGVAAMVFGLGNGISSGVGMTLGADASPVLGRSKFLGAWRLIVDTGATCGPLLLAGVTHVATLGAGIATLGGTGFVGALAMQVWLPRKRRPVEVEAD